MRRIKMTLYGNCPICGALITAERGIEESEVVMCMECQSMLVVDSVQSEGVILEQAPQIEEDWGE